MSSESSPRSQNAEPGLTLCSDTFNVGSTFRLTLQRTVRLPIDDRTYPLPPGFGPFPVLAAADETFMIPMHDHEALWIAFAGESWRPVAVKVAAGKVNAITGEPFDLELRAGRQDYMVVPEQPWLDGLKVDAGTIRQFVAVQLGSGQTVEKQVTGSETVGGLQIAVFQPVPGRFPDRPPACREGLLREDAVSYCAASPMGMGAGGRMRQKIYEDRYGVESWDEASVISFDVKLARAADWPRLTGRAAPPSPITAETYISLGLPWFDLADQAAQEVPASPALAGLKAVVVPDDLPLIVL